LGKVKFKDFVKHYIQEVPGPIIEYETGTFLGNHTGVWYHTIGQRQGLGLAGGPWYVVSKDVMHNTIAVSRNYYTQDKQRNSFLINSCNWLVDHVVSRTDLDVKLRHGAHRYSCTITPEHNQMRITINESDQGIALGQFAVLYDRNRCLGSGVINGY
jgi:tRNA-specific 2-thiouridylase